MSYTKEPWPVFTDIATTMTPDPEGTPVAILSWDDYIRARYAEKSQFGVTGDELQLLRHFVDIYRDFWLRQPVHLYEAAVEALDKLRLPTPPNALGQAGAACGVSPGAMGSASLVEQGEKQ